MSNYHTLYEKMHDNNIMLTFKGEVSFDLVNSVLKIMEERLDRIEENKKTRKKVYNVLVECLQNLCNHIETSDYEVQGYDARTALLIIETDAEKYKVVTGNYIPKDQVAGLKERLEQINSISKEELRELYKKILDNGQFSEKGGGGLGFIDIARKSGQKLKYEFENVNETVAFFTLRIDVPRKDSAEE
ncbi:MAG: hypothetical protein RLZZ175_1366 [Bacteroidota bacterium]|jgi:GMP synthase PP-ATPase subunit